MKHQDNKRNFGRKRNQRKALLRSLAENLIRDGKITTTEAKAKELRGFIEPLTTKARTGSLPAQRIVTARLGNVKIGKKLISEIAPRYKERSGGYTRVTKIGTRKGDGSAMAIIEFII